MRNTKLDLLIVMNNYSIADCYKIDAEREFGLTALDFTSGQSALEYLSSCSDDCLPDITLVDCFLNSSQETDYRTAIFHYLNERNAADNFHYLCFHMGPRERGLQHKTKAKFLKQGATFEKGDPVYDLMARLAEEKENKKN